MPHNFPSYDFAALASGTALTPAEQTPTLLLPPSLSCPSGPLVADHHRQMVGRQGHQ